MAVESVSPGAALEAAGEAMGRFDLDGAIAHLSAAVRGFTAADDYRSAAMASAQLGAVFGNFLGNKVAAQPWFLRAIRLLEDKEPCVEQGWVALAPMGCDVDDPALLLERAEVALALARQFGDVALEAKALADGGLALVQAGRLAEGMAMMDEGMALICGSADIADSHPPAVCSFFTACYYTSDLGRFEAWSPLLRQRGLIGSVAGGPAVLSSHCDSVQGLLLCQAGHWQEAEGVLERAITALEQTMPMMTPWHPPIALADLRILQGRLAEAEALLLGRDDHIQALLPMARLHLARGDFDLASASAKRGMRLIGNDRVRAAGLLGVLVEAELGRHDTARAAEASAELDARVRDVGLTALDVEAARLRARVRRRTGEPAAGVTIVEEALAALDANDTDIPLLRAKLFIELAWLHETLGDRPSAVIAARGADAVLSRLDVVLGADETDFLRTLGVRAAPAEVRSGCRVAALERDGAWWTVRCGDVQVRLRHTKGLHYLAELVAHPSVERHAIDLVDVVEKLPVAGAREIRHRMGDAGPMLDRQARAEYRRRVSELRDEVEDALAAEDDERAAKLQVELDTLVGELARAFGLGARQRHEGSVAEKARLNVTRAMRSAIAKVAEALPEAGAVLDRRVRTGLFCAYEPHPDDEILWSVQS